MTYPESPGTRDPYAFQIPAGNPGPADDETTAPTPVGPPAIEYPGVREALHKTARRTVLRRWRTALITLVVMALLVVAMVAVGGFAGGAVRAVLGFPLFIALLVLIFLLVVDRPGKKRRADERLLAEYPWQEVQGTVAHHVMPDGREGRCLTLEHLDEQHPTALFVMPWPEGDVPTPHGTTTFWFAGDARFGGFVALAGAVSPARAGRADRLDYHRTRPDRDERAVRAGLLTEAQCAGLTVGSDSGAAPGNDPSAGGTDVDRPLHPVAPAVAPPPTNASLKQLRRQAFRAMPYRLLLTALGLLATGMGVQAIVRGQIGGAFLVLLFGIVAFEGCAALWGPWSGYRRARRVLGVYAFQQWPALAQAAFARYVLLGPDGHPLVTLKRHGAGHALGGPSLERREILFAGDIRYGGVVLLPDGTQPTPVTCHPITLVESSAHDDELARAAGLSAPRRNAERFGRGMRRLLSRRRLRR